MLQYTWYVPGMYLYLPLYICIYLYLSIAICTCTENYSSRLDGTNATEQHDKGGIGPTQQPGLPGLGMTFCEVLGCALRDWYGRGIGSTGLAVLTTTVGVILADPVTIYH